MRFTVEKLSRRTAELRRLIYDTRLPLTEWRVHRAPAEGAAAPDYDDSSWPVVQAGQSFAGARERYWFRTRVTVPPGLAGRRIALHLKLTDERSIDSREGLVYVDGRATQGIDVFHREVLLSESAEPKRTYAVAIHGFVGMRGQVLRLEETELVSIDRAAERYYYSALTALEVAKTLPETSLDRANVLNALEAADGLVDWRSPGSGAFYASIARASALLDERLFSRPTGVDREKVTLVGHAHIDIAWLWTLDVTREKCGRTFATALKLMEQYPEYRFTQSQPQAYKYVKRDYPELYAGIKSRVAEGRWEPTGGMWLEADCNLSSGESLARQILYGRRFFRQEFGVENDTIWLPDVFGYSWALPGLMKHAGMKYFMTTKISWSQYNQPVNDTFYWQGIDGTKVLTHFITTPSENWFKTYNGEVTPEAVKGCWDAYHQKDINDEVLFSFGWGDGGGGPTKEQIETAGRLADFPGAPLVSIGTAEDFFRRLDARIQGKRVPVWNGELYLEYHRGTYTTQGRNKRANRQSEALYHAAELYGSVAGQLGAPISRTDLAEGWELILLNQFHDIIPGSSIAEVYEDSAADYAKVRAIGERALSASLSAIAGNADTRGEGRALIVWNSAPFDRTDVVSILLPDDLRGPLVVVDPSGASVPSQVSSLPGEGASLVFEADVPANGYAVYRVQSGEQTSVGAPSVRADTALIENGLFKVQVDSEGRLAGIFDKRAGREVLAEGEKANVFEAFEDKPMRFDAWDIDIFYQDKPLPVYPEDGGRPARVTLLEDGPVRATLLVEREYSGSTLSQRIHAYARTPRLDFVTAVEWHEKRTLLKVGFPVDIRATEATYEIQFGNVQRPTHWNTSWDWARFETCAQKWVDLSEGDYGVSLLNDCKYGHDIKGNLIRLSLLRSPTSPDPTADEGHHDFTYSLYPHQGSWRGGTIPEAYGLNNPLVAAWEGGHEGQLPSRFSLVRSSRENVVVETVKPAEDTDDIVVRVYESHNQRGPVTLTFARPILAAEEVNLLEESVAPVELAGSDLRFRIRPYQIRAFKVKLGRA